MTTDFYPKYKSGKLDADSEAILKQLSEMNIQPLSSMTVQQVRESFFETSWLGIPDPDINISNKEIENAGNKIPLRIYTPPGNGHFPIFLYFHGGGFVVGELHEFDAFCSYIASGAGCIVVSVGYRLSPEHKHPAAVEDARFALEWLENNSPEISGDASRIAVGGDSAGGNLAAVLSLLERKKILAQILICPWLDLSSTDTDSYKYFGDGLWLSTVNIFWYRDHYLQSPEQAKSFLVSPLLADNLREVSSAFIITSEFDVLKDEGEAYVNRLKNESVPVKYKCYEGTLHDFITLPGLFSKAKVAIHDICVELKNKFDA